MRLDVIVGTDALPLMWPQVEDMVEEVLNIGFNYTKIEDVKTAIEKEEMQLWLTIVDGRVLNGIITQVQTSTKTICYALFAFGVTAENWTPLYERIKEWAKTQGCYSLVTGVRPGLEKKYSQVLGKKTHSVFEYSLMN